MSRRRWVATFVVIGLAILVIPMLQSCHATLHGGEGSDASKPNPVVAFIDACDTYVSSLRILNMYRRMDKLSSDQIEAVTLARNIIGPLCDAYPADFESAAAVMLVIQDNLLDMAFIKMEVGKDGDS